MKIPRSLLPAYEFSQEPHRHNSMSVSRFGAVDSVLASPEGAVRGRLTSWWTLQRAPASGRSLSRIPGPCAR
jgi:hypothetical protein